MKLASAEQVRGLDAAAITEIGIPGIVLMENAGRGTVACMNQHFGGFGGKVVSIFVGPGNNGGDGLVIARHLHQQGSRPHVFMVASADKLKGDAATNLAIVERLRIPIHSVATTAELEEAEDYFTKSRAVVDSIFGTGLAREVSGHFAEVIQRINHFACPVIAVDIPSGLHSDTGQPLGVCVQADLTVTFGLAKPGQVLYPGAEYVGRLEVVDIGIPPEVVEQAGIQLELLEKSKVSQWIPARHANSHKGTFGHLLILAGSRGKTGAAILSGKGALHSGAGLVTLCVPRDLDVVFESALIEAMTIPLPASEGCLAMDDIAGINEALAGKRAVVLGPGMGTGESTAELVARLYAEVAIPMVVDADALNILARLGDRLVKPPAPRILTPHPGEMARLTGTTGSAVQADRLGCAREYARTHDIYLVLKGAHTVVAAPDGRVAVNPTGNAGMATGGMGDVLSGFLGGLLAQGLSPWQTACLGVYAHGAAADRLQLEMGGQGYLASEVAGELPLTLEKLLG